MWFIAIFTVLVQLCSATSPPSKWGEMVRKHWWITIPHGWSLESPAPADFTFKIRIGLKAEQPDALITTLMEVSEPRSLKYGHHLSPAEAETLAAPSSSSIQVVDEWLESHGIPPEAIVRQSVGGVWLTFLITVADAEKLLNTKYNIYYHAESSQYVVRAMSYSLPLNLHNYIDLITPTTYFGTPRSLSTPKIYPIDDALSPGSFIGAFRDILSHNLLQPILQFATTQNLTSSTSGPCSDPKGITPACLKDLYRTDGYVPAATQTNKLGVTAYWNYYANLTDLQLFFEKFLPNMPTPYYTTTEVNGGGNNESNPFYEADFDIQYTMAMTFPTPNVFYSIGGSGPSTNSSNPLDSVEPYLDWIQYLLSRGEIPQTITTSYSEEEQFVPEDYATTVCRMFAHLGVIGTTLFFSTGDVGVGFMMPDANDCIANDGTGRTLFQPHFPSSCPYITAVGGTTQINPEVAWEFSGGGFSRYFNTPRYQKPYVSRYVTDLGNKYHGLYNKDGRGYPDISAQAYNFQYIFRGGPWAFTGTSASTPTVAGIFTLLNDIRLANSKRPLGFINPLIYSLGTNTFNDIISGSNPGCNTTGFNATKGWDPVTGLGTPDFLKLKEFIQRLS